MDEGIRIWGTLFMAVMQDWNFVFSYDLEKLFLATACVVVDEGNFFRLLHLRLS
jgi:hypothetical protein